MKIFLIIGILSWQLFAADIESMSKIYYHIFYDITKKEKIKIFTDDTECKTAFTTSKHLILVDDASNADIILISKQENMKKIPGKSFDKKIIFFTTSYKLLKLYPQFIGAFYWKRGRSQLLFVKERLHKYHIKLPHEYYQYIVDIL